jgi:hypothetical protein
MQSVKNCMFRNVIKQFPQIFVSNLIGVVNVDVAQVIIVVVVLVFL